MPVLWAVLSVTATNVRFIWLVIAKGVEIIGSLCLANLGRNVCERVWWGTPEGGFSLWQLVMAEPSRRAKRGVRGALRDWEGGWVPRSGTIPTLVGTLPQRRVPTEGGRGGRNPRRGVFPPRTTGGGTRRREPGARDEASVAREVPSGLLLAVTELSVRAKREAEWGNGELPSRAWALRSLPFRSPLTPHAPSCGRERTEWAGGGVVNEVNCSPPRSTSSRSPRVRVLWLRVFPPKLGWIWSSKGVALRRLNLAQFAV